MQQTFTDMEYANRKRTTRREAFLEAMESIIPWNEWMKLIAPFYVQKGHGRKRIPLETMLRMHLMQNWFGLFGEGIEEAIYGSYAMKRFLKIDCSTEQAPDIACKIFDGVNSGWMLQDSSCTAGRLLTQRSSMHRVQPRTRRSPAIPGCTPPRREIRGSSA